MTVMRHIASYKGWEVVQDINGVISIRHGHGQWICDHSSAYDAICDEVTDPEARRALLSQWTKIMTGGFSK